MIKQILQFLWETWFIGGLIGSAMGLTYLYFDYIYDDWFKEGVRRTIWGIIFGWITVVAWASCLIVEMLAVEMPEDYYDNQDL